MSLKSLTIKGIDISHNNGTIQFHQAASEGIKFIFIKATQGTNFHDPMFAEYWAKVKGLVRRGAYHFFNPLEDGESQANFFLNTIKDIDKSDLPMVVDVEAYGRHDAWTTISRATAIERVLHFCQTVETKTGVKPMIYTSPGWWDGIFGDATQFSDYYLWVAEYVHESFEGTARLPLPWKDKSFHVWQWSESGTLAGVGNSSVDLDVARDDFFALTFPWK